MEYTYSTAPHYQKFWKCTWLEKERDETPCKESPAEIRRQWKYVYRNRTTTKYMYVYNYILTSGNTLHFIC